MNAGALFSDVISGMLGKTGKQAAFLGSAASLGAMTLVLRRLVRRRRSNETRRRSNASDKVSLQLAIAPGTQLEIPPERSQKIAGYAALVASLGSTAAVVVAIFALISTNTANRAQQRLVEQGQVTDRFTKAIDQLGQSDPTKIEIRLGGIYALQRIMRDSDADQPAVVQVLTAFVRVHAARNNLAKPINRRSEDTPPSPDIAAAMAVIRDRDSTKDGKDLAGRDVGLDLYGTNLVGLNLADVRLPEADLEDVNLDDSNLERAHLENARLAGANLSRAFMYIADLDGADLRGADLSFSLPQEADLEQADLSRANLRGADFSSSFLEGANLDGADLSGTNLQLASGVTTDQLSCARSLDSRTRLPDGVRRPTVRAPSCPPG